jgi:hypothetical protein
MEFGMEEKMGEMAGRQQQQPNNKRPLIPDQLNEQLTGSWKPVASQQPMGKLNKILKNLRSLWLIGMEFL